MRRRFLLLGLLLGLAACEKHEPDLSLDDVAKKMNNLVFHVMLGDTEPRPIPPFYHADWFVIIPPMATQASFEKDVPAFVKDEGEAVPQLTGKTEPTMALVTDGKVVAARRLEEPFTAVNVLAKPGKTVVGIHVTHLLGNSRMYRIVSID
jgi:hypothetical protein